MLVILLAALLLGLTLALLYLYSFKSIKSSIGHRAESELRETGLKIRGVMSEMELALKNNLWIVFISVFGQIPACRFHHDDPRTDEARGAC